MKNKSLCIHLELIVNDNNIRELNLYGNFKNMKKLYNKILNNIRNNIKEYGFNIYKSKTDKANILGTFECYKLRKK